MKKLLPTLTFALGLCLSSFAQNISYLNTTYFTSCNSGTNTATPINSSTPGVSPGDSVLPCITRGIFRSDTIYITNYTMFDGLPVNYLKVDSIYLPTGLCWNTNKANNQFAGGESGVIIAQGITDAPQGQYKLRIIVDANAGIGGVITLTNQNAETLIGLRYRVRVIDTTGCPCPAMNHTDTTDSYIAYSCLQIGGIDEPTNGISGLTIAPNPFSQKVTISFSSETEGRCIVKLSNLIGSEVSSKEANIRIGQNDIIMDRNGLPAGMYLLTISTSHGNMTGRVVVE